MPTQVQFRRGTATQNNNFTGAAGELTVDTTDYSLRIHDGSTQGGNKLALADGSNLSGASGIDTDDLTEGSTNLYHTTARVRAALSAGTGIAITDGEIATTITQYLDSDARGSVSVTDSGGDGSLSYNSTTGVFTYTGPSATEVRAHLSAGTGVSYSSGEFSIGQSVGTTDTVTFAGVTAPITGNVTGTVSDISNHDTDDLAEGSNLYYTDARARASVSAGGSLSYNSTTGVISYTTPTTISSLSNHDTDDLGEGATNQYFTTARARSSVSGGTGITYNSTSGAIAVDTSTIATRTYADSAASTAVADVIDAAPSTLDTLNELAAALGDDANFSTTVTNSIATKLATADFTSTADTWLGTKDTDDVTEGTTNLFHTTARARASISAGGSLSYNSTTGVISYTTPTTIASLSNHDTGDLAEGSNLYYTDARARAAVSVSGSLGYNSSTGVISYTTPTTIASLSNHDTDDLAEGSNLYHTTARARGAVSASGDLSYNSTTGVFSFNETYSTASELLTAIKTVDGSGSGLDADLLDGQSSAYYRINIYNSAGTLLN